MTTWTGTNGFRMFPADPMQTHPSTAVRREVAGGHGWLLEYTWVHPTDGDQSGVLLAGSPDEGGAVTASWLDSWHQKPDVRLLTGTLVSTLHGDQVELEYDYGGGWRWRIVVGPAQDGPADALTMTMLNVVPAGHPGAEPGPHEVMRAHWRA